MGGFRGIELGEIVVTDERHTVYIVDGDEAVRDSLTAFLDTEGYTTKSFVSCKAFHEKPRLTGSACLLLDLQLPRYGGEDLLACLSKRVRQLPVIVMSGAARSTREPALRTGAAAFIEKPLDSNELIQTLHKIFA